MPAVEPADAPPVPLRPGARRVDAGVAVAILFAFGALSTVDGAVMFREPLWLDEVHTAWIAERPGFGEVLGALRQGADFNPPLLFAWHWLIAQFAGHASPVVLRLTALLSVCAALVLTWRLLRRSYDPLPALIGVATLGSTSLVIEHAFEARFYGPWLLLTVLYVTALTRVLDSNGALRGQVLAGCIGALLCIIHYFGIITLTLATAGAGIALLLRRQRLRLLWPPFLSGMAALALTLPLLLGQKAALSGPVWITPACCASELLLYLESFLALPQVSLVLIIAALAWILPQFRRSASSARAPVTPDPAVTALLAIGLLPVVLVTIELAGQPVLIPRYALPALVALAPITAAASASLRGIARLTCLLAVAVHGVFVARAAQLNARTTTTNREREREAGQAAIRQAREMQSVVIVPRRHLLYPLLEMLPTEAAPLFAMPMLPVDVVRRRFPIDTDSAAAGSTLLMEQDVARVHERTFGRPTLISIDAAADSTCWLLLDTNDSPAFATRWLPGHRARRIRPLLFLLEPTDTSGRSRECGPVRAGSTRVTFAPVLPAMRPFPAPTSPPTSTR